MIGSTGRGAVGHGPVCGLPGAGRADVEPEWALGLVFGQKRSSELACQNWVGRDFLDFGLVFIWRKFQHPAPPCRGKCKRGSQVAPAGWRRRTMRREDCRAIAGCSRTANSGLRCGFRWTPAGPWDSYSYLHHKGESRFLLCSPASACCIAKHLDLLKITRVADLRCEPEHAPM